MIAYKSKLNIMTLLIFSLLMLGLGIWSFWMDITLILKILSFILMLSISSVLLYAFIYYMKSSKEAIVVTKDEIIIISRKTKLIYQLKDIREVSFNFNVPYLAIAFTFSIVKHNGQSNVIGVFIRKQIRFYKLLKQILLDNNIEVTRSFYL